MHKIQGISALWALSLTTTAHAAPPLPDKGIFPDLDDRVTVEIRSDLAALGTLVVVDDSHGMSWLMVGDTPIGPAPASDLPRVHVRTLDGCDADRDGIPDPVDILIGAKKTALDAAPYTGGYYGIAYPGGDVPRSTGVCSDVIVRALRNAGYDLQKLVHEDIVKRRRAYPSVRRPDTNIDHRRVRTLLPWFGGHWRTVDAASTLLPGDVVFLDTLPEPGPDHIGVISDTLGEGMLPLVINSWTDGFRTSAMPLLTFVPVTHRYRVRCDLRALARSDAGLSGVLARAGLVLPEGAAQVLLVTSAGWNDSSGELYRFGRTEGGFASVGDPIHVNLGRSGLGWGRGAFGAHGPGGPTKAEGDGRSPAGVFELGTAFGYGAVPPARTRWPWRMLEEDDLWVDDPASALYNTLQRVPAAGEPRQWASAEAMRTSDGQYSLGIVVRHNDAPVLAGAGSAIFVHVEAGPGSPTAGCTSMARADLERVLAWLDPRRHPVLVQVPGVVLR